MGSYDLNGNLVSAVSSGVTNLYEWDAANRLVLLTQIAANKAVLASEFAYDGLGRRVRIVEKTNNVAQSDRRFLWCALELCEERDASGGTVVRRFFGEGEQIAGTNYYFTTDHLGSVREVTDAGGALRARYDYDPYGSRHKISGDLDCSFGFTGHYFHAPSGLFLALFRVYDPNTARWLSRDPLEEQGGLNLYAYVLGNPVNLLDPLGLSFWGCFGEGFLHGLVAGAMVSLATGALIGLGVSAPLITSGLVLLGGLSGIITGLNMMADKSYDNIGYNLGSFFGGAVIGGVSGRIFSKRLSSAEHQPPDGWKAWSPIRDWKQQWRFDPHRGISGNWIDAMPTGPNPLAASGAVSAIGSYPARYVAKKSSCTSDFSKYWPYWK